MQKFKRTSIAIIGSAMLLLSACNTNNNDNAADQNRSAKVENTNNGHLMNEKQPYRTTQSSDQYPHTTSIQHAQGERKFFRFVNKKVVQQTNRSNQQAGGNNNASPPPPAQNNQKEQAAPKEQQRQPAAKSPAPAPAPAKSPAPAPAPTNQATAGISQFEKQVIDLTNAQRKKNGLSALQADTSLSKVAKTKSNDMQQKNYFSHTSPTYGSPFDMIRDFGVSYKSAGENIAKGQASPEAVVNAWMNSEGHRKNIMNPNFTHIGVGHQASGNYWTQMFIGK